MTTDQFITHTALDRSQAQPFEVGVVHWTREPGTGGRTDLSSGFWFVSPEDAPDPMTVVAHADETIFIIEGRLRIEPQREAAFELSAGSSASMNKGSSAVWTILEPTVEFFVYS